MINKIQLQNFQSHAASELNLHPGINAVVGSSNSGKTSCLRALNWAIYNRPSGDAFVSYWARDKKGKQINQTLVRIEKESGNVERGRDKDFNGYTINGTKLEAIKTDVPDAIKDFFNVSEVNIQKQMDAPFLLSQSSGEIARFFNRIIKLDEIDLCLASADKKKRECARNIKEAEDGREKLEKELKEYSWIDEVLPLLDKIDRLQSKIESKQAVVGQLESLYRKHEENTVALRIYVDLSVIEGKIRDAEAMNTDIGVLETKRTALSKILESYEYQVSQREAVEQLTEIEQPVERSLKLYGKLEAAVGLLNLYKESVQDHTEYRERIEECGGRIVELQEQLPSVCPLCGAPMKKE